MTSPTHEQPASAETSSPEIVNISGYKFVPLEDLESIRASLLKASRANGLKGTILLSQEGINCFVAGSRQGIDEFLSVLRSLDPFEDFDAKESLSEYQPFNRMLVKIKNEIITFDQTGIRPHERPSPKVDPLELKRWLDEGREVVLLDTRNDYEIELGTFDGAQGLHIDNFREFPEAIQQLPDNVREKPLVMFCTGGIRCEKAGPFMQQAGFKNVYQLDGGILKYFEKCGGAHWHGECFVFDKRVALDPDLAETATTLCFVCQAVLRETELSDKRYEFGVSCPFCFQPEATGPANVCSPSQRNEQIAEAVDPLPGSVPYDNFRPMSVAKEMDGLPLLDFLNALRTHLTPEQWIGYIDAGEILHKGKAVGMDRKVMHGQKYYHLMPDTVEPEVNGQIEVLYEDDALVAIAKPAPIPMHPCGRFNRNSLQTILQEVYQPDRLRLVHRLDANTTGVVLYARSKPLATELQQQFADSKVRKSYLAAVAGHPIHDRFESERRIAGKPGPGGIRFIDDDGQIAHTRFEVLQRKEVGGEPRAILRVTPETGRTNQIRLHLWDAGWPIVGDPTYLQNGAVGYNKTLPFDAPPMCLHAWQITFNHPTQGKRITIEAPLPQWLEEFDNPTD